MPPAWGISELAFESTGCHVDQGRRAVRVSMKSGSCAPCQCASLWDLPRFGCCEGWLLELRVTMLAAVCLQDAWLLLQALQIVCTPGFWWQAPGELSPGRLPLLGSRFATTGFGLDCSSSCFALVWFDLVFFFLGQLPTPSALCLPEIH